MSIELTFVGYKDSIPIYSPIDKKDQDALMGHAVIECTPKKRGTRTSQQNRAMHLFFARLVEALNDAGLDMKKVLKPEIDIPWSQTAVKEFKADGVEVEKDGEILILEPFQTVIMASGMLSAPEPDDEIKKVITNIEIIGDADNVKDTFTAVRAGYELACKY